MVLLVKVCGILIGSLQFASILFLEKSLGASSFYSSVAGLPICTKKLQKSFPYLAKFRSGLQNWLALSFSAGSVLGAAVSSVSSGVFATAAGVHPYNAFLGGFIMVLGARIGEKNFIQFHYLIKDCSIFTIFYLSGRLYKWTRYQWLFSSIYWVVYYHCSHVWRSHRHRFLCTHKRFFLLTSRSF